MILKTHCIARRRAFGVNIGQFPLDTMHFNPIKYNINPLKQIH